MRNGMDTIYNLWNLVFRSGKKESDTVWMKLPKVPKDKNEEVSDIVKKQMALILDSPDRKNSNKPQ